MEEDVLRHDATSLSILLNELQSEFDRCMREGDSFDHLKRLYLEIKELMCYLTALQWQGGRVSQFG